VPGAVRTALSDELDALSPTALAFVRGAAVVGEPCAPGAGWRLGAHAGAKCQLP
jgi:hypothetical protein